MDTQQRVETMTDEQVLATFGTDEEPTRRGFDDATYARVLAYELIRSRHRLASYRTLYASFAEEDAKFMIENLDEEQDGQAVPAKLVFTDDPDQVRDLEDEAEVVVWTEPELLLELTRERAVLDYLTGLLEELEPVLRR